LNSYSFKRDVERFKNLYFVFGVNIENRDAEGFFIYNCNRLILMFEPSKQQARRNKDYRGVVGIVNVPYFLSNPTHNKQNFEIEAEGKALLNSMSDFMDAYVKDYKPDYGQGFWRTYGYESSSYLTPFKDGIYLTARLLKIKLLMQCSNCEKWRALSYHESMLRDDFYKEDWTCRDIPGKNSIS
jgi:hypothetical protein